MKILKPAAPALLRTLSAGDLFYVIGGDRPLLALLIRQTDNDHPYLTPSRLQRRWARLGTGSPRV